MKKKAESDNNPLDNLKEIARSELNKVDELVFELIKNKISLIPDISAHTISSGGKRLRPLLTLVSARICNYKGDADISLAACVEFIHTATLLHDDVVDKSELRRGSKTANNLWGNKESVLVGDFLLGKAFDLMGDANSLEVYKTLSNAALVISEGEVLQLASEGDINLKEEIYFKIIEAKTAKLFSAACKVGGIISNKSQDEINALSDYGNNLGIAFQIIDDLLDYFSSSNISGKNIGDDFFEKKMTLPLIKLFNQIDYNDKKIYIDIFSKDSKCENDLKSALHDMDKYDIYNKVIKVAKDYSDKAVRNLNIFEDSIYKDSLINLANYTVNRLY